MQRERWTSRTAFVMAAIGSAVGLGNFIRFPYVAFENGGGAFLIPYFIALLTAGIPLMILEYGIGQKMQGAAPLAMSRIGKNREWVGWWALGISTLVAIFYAVVMGWCWQYLWHSFSRPLPWAENPSKFFFEKILNISNGPKELGGIVTGPLIGLIITWTCVFLIIHKGLGRVGKVVAWTVPLPIICILILGIRGLTLKGASIGINYYLRPDFSVLTNPKTWLAAYGQVFFSLTLGFGVLIAYASYLPKKADVCNNAFITSFANCLLSFIAGFAIFSTLGYAFAISGAADFNEWSKGASSGLAMAFMVYPKSISQLPAGQNVFAVIFFLALLTLGIDSLFSLAEAAVSGLHDKWNISRGKATFFFCLFCLLAGLPLVTRGGLFWLDIVERWSASFGLAAIGAAECIAIGWFLNLKTFRKQLNEESEVHVGLWWDICIKYITPTILIWCISASAIEIFYLGYEGYPVWALWVGGWILVISAPIIGIILMLTKVNREGRDGS